MTERTKRGLKLAAAAIFAALLVAITFNAAVDFWTPQAAPGDPSGRAGVPSPASLRTSVIAISRMLCHNLGLPLPG